MRSPSELTNEFIRYDVWANRRLLESCRDLSKDDLSATAVGTYGTVYDTLAHIVRAEGDYLFLLTGRRMDPPFVWKDRPPVADFAAYYLQVSDALIDAASKVRATDVVKDTWEDGKVVKFKAATVLIQIVNHGVEHRTNVTTIMTQLGVKPPEIDGWGYLDSNQDRLGE